MIEIDGITVRGCISFDRSKKRHFFQREGHLAQTLGG